MAIYTLLLLFQALASSCRYFVCLYQLSGLLSWTPHLHPHCSGCVWADGPVHVQLHWFSCST